MSKKSLKENYFYNLLFQILQIITPFITAPYISRVLTVEGIGIQSFTQSIVNYFLLFGGLSIGLYGQREIAYNQNNEYERSKLFWELIIIKIITISLILCVYIVIIQNFSAYYSYFLIYIVEIIASLFDVTWFYRGIENFKIIAVRNIILRIASICCIFIIIKGPNDLWKYILLYSLSGLITSISLIPSLLKQVIKIKLRTLNIIRHIKPIIILFIPQIAIQVYTVLDKSMIGFITQSTYENGCYEQAMKIVKLPLTVITSLGAVVVPRIAHYNATGQNDKIKESMIRSFAFVFLLGTPMLFGLIGIADIFVPIFFGSGYDKSIILIKILSGLLLIIGLNVLFGIQCLIPQKKENVLTIIVTIGAIINFALNIFFIPRYQSVGAAFSSVIAEGVIMIFYFVYLRDIINIKKVFLQLWRYIAASIIMFIGLCLLKLVMEMNIVNLIYMILSGCIIYLLLLILFHDKLLFSTLNTMIRYMKRSLSK
jgi:O-antigen/teichoic acid export membrane protein